MRYAEYVIDSLDVDQRLRKMAEEAVDGFVRQMSRYLNEPISRDTIEIEVFPPPHFPKALPTGKQAVFAFYWPEQDRFLMVALSGPNSNARFQSQHYLPTSSGSNLARKILQQKEVLGIGDVDENTVGLWMKGNLARVNFYLPADIGKEVLKYFKDYLRLTWRPAF